jgi:isopentenyl diphosphate isomerase/L-lactate dehydrogenase-like FMN-dependent dehydrogenase
MELSEIYQKGKEAIRKKEYGFLLEAVETGFILENDRRVLDHYTFRPRYIDGVEPETRCNLMGVELGLPVIMSAMTMPIPAIHPRGLLEVAEGLREAGSLLWTGTPLPEDLEDLVASGVPVASNVKPFKDRSRMFRELEKIQKSGVRWVGVEIDAGQGTKIRDTEVARDCSPLSLKELRQIRTEVSCPLIAKGVLSSWDALKCVDEGLDGIVVSNHGAHTLDYLPHPLQVMEEILSASQGRLTIIVDGGFRRGSDVVKGLAFGASLVGLGRPILYGLAAAGKDGVRGVLHGIRGEMVRIMSLLGAREPSELTREMLIKED